MMAAQSHSGTSSSGIDTTAKFVRLTEVRPDGFVAFDFAIGEPEIYVEMLLSAAAFEEFCETNAVIRLDGETPSASEDGNDFLWRLRDAARAAAGDTAPSKPVS